jgi:hypothetical protein
MLFPIFVIVAVLLLIDVGFLGARSLGKVALGAKVVVAWNAVLAVAAIAGVVLTMVQNDLGMLDGGGAALLAACGVVVLQFADNAMQLLSEPPTIEGRKKQKKMKAERSVAVNPSSSSSSSSSSSTSPPSSVAVAGQDAAAAVATTAAFASDVGDFEGDSEWGDDPPATSGSSGAGGLFQARESSEELELIVATFKNNILSLGRDNYSRVLNDILSRGINRMDAKILQRMSTQLVGSILPLRHANAVVAAIKRRSGGSEGGSMFRVSEFRGWIEN